MFTNILQPLIDIFEQVMLFFHDQLGFSWGWSIIGMTVVVRALMIPLTLKQFRSMQALQQFSPQIKELQAKYKDDRQRLNQEMMKFYQENKVNPFGSCLPLLLQLPVFISLFYMLQKDLRLDICGQSENPCGPGAASFLGIPDITDKAGGMTLVVLLVLYVGSQLLSSLLMSSTMTDRNQRMIMLALPFIFIPFIINFPAGLMVYWITTNLWTVGQQAIIRRTVGKPPADLDESGLPAPPKEGKGTGRLFGAMVSRAQQASEQQAAASGSSGEGSVAASSPAAKKPPSAPPPRKKKKKRSGRRR
jgi:YidC/Oxa1 family membrane protein insertase